MKLKSVLSNTGIIYDESLANVEITGISIDSRSITKGDLFIALKGTHTDGNAFVNDALKKGASVCIVNSQSREEFLNPERIIRVSDTQKILAQIASNFYSNPTKDMLVIGVTGTNGKTTITYLLESIFKINNRVGVIGTINYRYKNKIIPATNTTPFAHTLMKILADMQKDGINTVIMETSSHALDQKRVDGCDFDCAIFTNLTQDHLDYHGSMLNYFNAKARLFKEILPQSRKKNKFSIINVDDEWGKKLADDLDTSIKTIRCSLVNQADFSVKKITLATAKKTTFICEMSGKTQEFGINLIGRYNISNALLSIAAAYSLGVPIATIKKGLLGVKKIPGRLETLHSPCGFTVVIDYAHTPDALSKVIATLKELKPKKLVTVFGCGGDRDRTKRPLMGQIAAAMSDFVVVTSDNPRTEDPYKIMLDIEMGIKKSGSTNYQMIPDRREAIKYALNNATTGDIVLLAGKGHENYQIIGTEKLPFSDSEIANEIMKK